MDARTIYTCSLCSAESMATVTLDDPRKHITEEQ